MSFNDIKIPSSTLAELRGALVRVLSRENLSMNDKIAIRKSQSSSSLKIHYSWNASYGGKRQCLFRCEREKKFINSERKKSFTKIDSTVFKSSAFLLISSLSMCV